MLEAKNLSVGYQYKKQQKIVVKNVDFTIERGKFIAILGKNGIGKSTLLRTLSGVQKPISGKVFINQKNTLEYTSKQLATTLSLVLTERLPESQLTVFELVALGRQPYTNWIDTLSKNDLEKIDWALGKTEITHLKNNRFYELSDGQLQRVLIARALAQDTEIILLDEPTVYLDLHHTFKIFSLLKNLVATTQKTIIISTHQLNLAIQLADEFVLLSDSKIHTGTAEKLIAENCFEALFSNEFVSFNKKLQQFVVNKK